MLYRYRTEPDDGATRIIFPDVPAATTFATEAEDVDAVARAGLLTALAGHASLGHDWPPAKARRGAGVRVPPLEGAKLELMREMARQKVSNAELARRLGVTERTVRLLLDFDRQSHIDKIDRALGALGKQVTVAVMDAA